jgi:hypothetical protein
MSLLTLSSMAQSKRARDLGGPFVTGFHVKRATVFLTLDQADSGRLGRPATNFEKAQ